MGRLIADANFKAIFRNQKVADKFIKILIPDLSVAKEEEVKEYQVVGNLMEKDYVMDDEEADRYVMPEEFDYLPEQESDNENKAPIHDVLFTLRSDVIPTRNNIITVDFEMQGKNQNYPIAMRGTYYASKLHAQTVRKGQNYNVAHKVYSIWLLNYKNWKDEIPVRSVFQSITYTERGTVELNGRVKKSLDYDINSDGMEIIYIELPKIDRGNISKELKKILLSIRDGDDLVKVVEDICGLESEEAKIMQSNLNTMVNKVNPYVEMGREEGIEKGIRGSALMLIELNIDRMTSITKLRETYDLTDAEAERFYEEALKEAKK